MHPVGLHRLYYYFSYFTFVWDNSLILIRLHLSFYYLYIRNDYKIYLAKNQELEVKKYEFTTLTKGLPGLEIYNKTPN